MDKKKIAVRYCGGCNPRYDRTAAERQLASLFPECEFVMFQAEQVYQAAIVVCGCPAQCAGISDLRIPLDRLVLY